MTNPLPSAAEQHAAKASQLKAFAGLNLVQIRNDLTEMLSAIRGNGLFEEYTKHDISHVDAMLAQLDWLIPSDTQEIMTHADWLLIVLSAYFHDLGMLVTRDEYEAREASTEFTQFQNDMLAAGDDAQEDYAARVRTLRKEDLDLFLYQEYVRTNHARRIRAWIEDKDNPQLGVSGGPPQEVARLLNGAAWVFREDLAIVCESHHLDDLDNTTKYKVRRYYGSHPQEMANVQYAAILLRTMDLLHITSDRTPSVAFRIISPRDPISQQEWAKQLAVRSIQPQLAFDSEGNQNTSLPKNTIEVHATYDNSDGFFGLTDYLAYAEGQIRTSSDLITASSKKFDLKYRLPWRFIDTSNVEAVGFINRPFEFTLDQRRILDLLTGHTLYNDSSVVLRELLQNSIDAVRLAHGSSAPEAGKITVKWDDESRVLEIMDNGTGMTQEIIENNFLHVGSSYYQSPAFKKSHPTFSPISRFGIGVLSAFMVADQVEVITCHADETESRLVELRSVHGKYLIRILDKNADPAVRQLLPSGTLVRLHVRPSAKKMDVIRTARNWVIVPGCKVMVAINRNEEVSVGYESVEAALQDWLVREGLRDQGQVKVISKTDKNVSLAYVATWSRYFKEWIFHTDDAHTPLISGTCVEGIRVQTGAPGFSGQSSYRSYNAYNRPLVALVNVVGSKAPKTNAARSDFELTPEYRNTLKEIYSLYCAHIDGEVERIEDEEQHSLTWAVSEIPYLIEPIADTRYADVPSELIDALQRIPMFLLEDHGSRIKTSFESLSLMDHFWTIEGAFSRHMEQLLREVPESISFTQLLEVLGSKVMKLPDGPLLCTNISRGLAQQLILGGWVISDVVGDAERRRCEVKWVKAGGHAVWSPAAEVKKSESVEAASMEAVRRVVERLRYDPNGQRYGLIEKPVRIPLAGVTARGFSDGENAASVQGVTHLLPGGEWLNVIKNNAIDDSPELASSPGIYALSQLLMFNVLPSDTMRTVVIPMLEDSGILKFIDIEKYLELHKQTNWKVFDTRRWERVDERYVF